MTVVSIFPGCAAGEGKRAALSAAENAAEKPAEEAAKEGGAP